MKNKILLLAVSVGLAACTNISQYKSTLTTLTTGTTTTTSSGVSYTQLLKNVSIDSLTTLAADGSTNIELTLATDTRVNGYQPLTQYCGTGTTNPCSCELVFNQVTVAGSTSYTNQRNKRIAVTTVQNGLVKCSFSSTFWNEIPDATQIAMNIIPGSGNLTGLSVQKIIYKKGTSITANGDFLDSTLTPFRNIHRYSCFSKWSNSYELLNAYQSITDPSGSTSNSFNVLIANSFCGGGASGGGPTCPTPRAGYSAQSYYRNLYIRSDNLGQINSTNSFYDCPKVLETLQYSAGQPTPTPSGTGNYWPLDTSFALATTYSSDWSVGVSAASVLMKAGDPNSVSGACTNENTAKQLTEYGMATKCLGYAKIPNTNGTCGSITDSNGRVRPMTRLRRFRVIYPPRYDYGTQGKNGGILSGAPEADQVYVADRLVVDSNGVPTGNMIYGPKPCNYSWFDHEGVANRDLLPAALVGQTSFGTNIPANAGLASRPSYVSTSSYCKLNALGSATVCSTSVNPDGMIFPNLDRDGTIGGLVGPSCSAALPKVEENIPGTPAWLRLLTTNANRTDFLTFGSRKLFLNEIHVKPIDPWTPNYVEDTSFSACVPLSDPYLEPPLHFYKKGTVMSWCSEPYPTQNPYWTDLNAVKKTTATDLAGQLVNFPAPGFVAATSTPYAQVQGYTSHDTNSAEGIGDAHLFSSGTLDVTYPNSSTLDSLNHCSGTLEDAICLTSSNGGSAAGSAVDDCKRYLKGTYSRKTCDRTVLYDANLIFRGFPLQAPDKDIEAMLSNDISHDQSFSCQYSVNSDQSKVGTQTPSSGCCGVVSGTALLNSVVNYNPIVYPNGVGGHLEPYTNGAVPNIRFCGNPVQ